MEWAFGNWHDFLKKKACRYLLQHYLGQFLKEKLSLDQLSLDLYKGTGKISDLNLDVQAINDDLATLNIPVELVDGFISCISVNIPWSALINDNTVLEITGLELTLQPKQRDDAGMMAGDMFSSMQSSMTTSLQLAKECLESESKGNSYTSEPIEGVQKFAFMIDSVLSKIKVTLLDTVFRLEHHPQDSLKGVALEIRVKRIEYFDDLATTQADGSSVDGHSSWEPAAISQKNIRVEGVQILFEEMTQGKPVRSRSSSRSTSDGSPPQMFQSTRSSLHSNMFESLDNSIIKPANLSPPTVTGSPTVDSSPVQIAVLTGRQEVKLKTKQSDTLHGPKLEIQFHVGGLHILLSPKQLHGLIDLVSGLNTPGGQGGRLDSKSGLRNKPMEAHDFERVEVDLQRQLQSGRVQSNNLTQMQDFSLNSEEDNNFFSLTTRQADMDSSYSSNISAVSSRSSSTLPSSAGYMSRKSQRDQYSTPKYHEDPSAELSQYHLRVAFFSVTLFHNNPTVNHDNSDKSVIELMRERATKYFSRVGGVTVAGLAEMKDMRKNFADLLDQDNLRMLGKPLNIECNQKSALKQVSTTINVRVGIMEVVESLYNKRSGQDTAPEVCQIITFKKDGSSDLQKSTLYSSMQGASPCLNVELKSITTNKSLSTTVIPRTDITVSMGELQTELDLTMIDRINSVITPEKIVNSSPLTGASMYHTVGAHFNSMMEEGSNSVDEKYVITVTCPCATVNLRFPIPDLRQEPHVDKSWYNRNLRDDVLTLDLYDTRFQTTFITNQLLEQIQFVCSDIHGFYKPTIDAEGQHFAHVAGEGGEEGFNMPSLTIKFCNTSTSLLDEDVDYDDTTPGDSLNGACQFARSEPSPFSSKRFMHDKDVGSNPGSNEKTEQMVLPADREELNEFMQKSISNTKMMVDIVLPKVCSFFPDKSLFEILYNRFNNDLLLWEPSAPAPVTNAYEKYSMPQHQWDLNVYNQFLHNTDHFEMAKSGQIDTDSDSDNESINHYSIHDSRYHRREKQQRQLQSNMCLTLCVGKGRLSAFTEAKDPNGCVQTDKHGEILLQISDLLLFTVSAHNGDPHLQFLNVLANRLDLYHEAKVENNNQVSPVVNCGELSKHVPEHLQSNHLIYRSEKGVLVTTQDKIGLGGDSLDMLSVALKIKLSTMASKTDLTVDERVKEFLVSVGIRGATLRQRMLPPFQNVFVQLMSFLDVKDYPILGYVDPKVLTELHVHLWTCAIDYRPKHLPLRSVLTAESFSISSNIVTESAISLLRFVLDDGALYLSTRTREQRTNIAKYFVCVADIGRLELLLRSNEGKDPRFPKRDLKVSTNRLNVRTCADSCIALIDLIKYLAADGDLVYVDMEESDTNTETETNLSINTEDGDTYELPDSLTLPPLSESKIDHVHSLLTDAMMQSSNSEEESDNEADKPEIPRTNKKQTEVFFVPQSGPESGLSLGSQREPIFITQNVDSVTSSTMSGMTGSLSETIDQDVDDFCFIEDAAWGKSHKDGEPTIRIFTQTTIEIKDNYFARPIGRTDLLKAPDNFPLAEYRYTMKELTVVWHIYGGKDFDDGSSLTSGEEHAQAEINRDSLTVSFHSGPYRWSGQAAGREAPLIQRETLQTKGGPQRDFSKCMEFQLTKVRFQHEEYPLTAEQASRQVLLINDIEIRDKLKQSKINKFLYQYSSEDMPKQTYANMVHLKALHRRPNPPVPEEECSIKLSIQPIRLNIDQDTLFFLKSYIMELSGTEDMPLSEPQATEKSPVHGSGGSNPPPPVLSVNKPDSSEGTGGPQELLMQFDEFTQDLQASLGGSSVSSTKSDKRQDSQLDLNTLIDDNTSVSTPRSSQPVFIKSFVFSPDVPIKLDYHGKFDRDHGAMATLGGLVSLHSAEIKLKRLQHKQGLLGSDKLVSFCLNEWLTDVKVNQLPNILGGFGPMHSFVQLAHGIKDLFWLPVEQYRKDGRIVRGLQRGAASFTMSTAMSMLELTNRVVQSVQWCAELTFDMVSPGPRRRGYYPRQPADLREGVSNAYFVIREGFSETATNIVDVASKEHESKGVMGAMGGVIRQIPSTMVQPLIILPEATCNVLGGLRSQLRPDVKKEDEEKWKEEIID